MHHKVTKDTREHNSDIEPTLPKAEFTLDMRSTALPS